MKGRIYQFEDYLLDVSQQRLQKNGQEISLPPRVFETLAALVERHGQLVGYDDLMSAVWKDTFVEEGNLRYCIHTLRKTLERDCIETVPKRGYRFTCKVESFTPEEFIHLHTSRENSSQTEKYNFSEKGKKAFSSDFSKTFLLLFVALLITGSGLSGFYFWRAQSFSNNKETAFLESLTVVPFRQIGENFVSNADFQKGLADALIFNLGKIRDLNVTPVNNIQTFFEQEFDPLVIGKEFKSDNVLEGSYRNEGENIRVNARLLRIKDGEPLLTESFIAKAKNQIELENLISFRIARKIELRIERLKDEILVKNQKIGEETARNYLAARQILRNYEHNRRKEVAGLFEKIIAAEPDWSLAHSGYAEAMIFRDGMRVDWTKAREIAERAVELDNSNADAHVVLGIFYHYHWDWEQAEKAYRAAIESEPQNAAGYYEYGIMLNMQRRFAEAETMFQKAVELKPFSPMIRALFCEHYYFDQKLNRALEQCFAAEKIEPNFWISKKQMFWINALMENYAEMERMDYGHLTDAEKFVHPIAKPLADRNMKLYWQRRIEERAQNTTKKESPVAIAVLYAYLKDKEKVLEYLERAADDEQHYLPRANPDPVFDFVRKDERFVELMKKINLNP